MKIGYGTYGMPSEPVFEALPRLRDLGYEAVEINAGDDWPTAPHRLDMPARDRLVKLLQDLAFPPPVIMSLLPICAVDDKAMLAKFDAACALVRDLNFGETPGVLVSTPGAGGLGGTWETARVDLCRRLCAMADRASRFNVILAVEPHAGQMLDTPDKVAWLMRETNHPFLKINFDHSHFHVAGIDLQHSVALCAPYTVSTHLKDGFMENGRVRYLLPGEGDLDLVAYFKAVAEAGIAVPITVEITAQIWKQSGYDPWAAAAFAFRALDKARKSA